MKRSDLESALNFEINSESKENNNPGGNLILDKNLSADFSMVGSTNNDFKGGSLNLNTSILENLNSPILENIGAPSKFNYIGPFQESSLDIGNSINSIIFENNPLGAEKNSEKPSINATCPVIIKGSIKGNMDINITHPVTVTLENSVNTRNLKNSEENNSDYSQLGNITLVPGATLKCIPGIEIWGHEIIGDQSFTNDTDSTMRLEFNEMLDSFELQPLGEVSDIS